MKTILASAYAINPNKGSEDGMGWNFIYQIARYNKVIAITRENNKQHIENFKKENPDFIYDNITFLYFDLPYWARFWKKGGRGALLYYYLWQRLLPKFIRNQNLKFDITHNVNFHNDWTPSYLWKLNKPFVWGPIGHHPKIPREYLRGYKKSYLFKNLSTQFIKKTFWMFSFSLKQTRKNASHIFCMNKSVPKVLNLTGNYSIVPSVATQDFGFDLQNKGEKFTIITAGRLVPLKGFDLTIRSFGEFLHSQPIEKRAQLELVVVGSGPELENYKTLTKELRIEQNVTFIEWMNRQDLMKLFKKASVFLFPSHEGAGMVVAEALSFGLPVLCLDNCGPGEFIDSTCGFKASYTQYNQTVKELAIALKDLLNNPELLNSMSTNARKHFESSFNWDLRGEEFRKVYLKL